MRRYPTVGGVAAWRVPVLTGLLVAGALALRTPDLALAALILGGLAHRLWRMGVVEVSPTGLTRGFLLRGTFLPGARVIPWLAVVEIHTEWCRPGDDSALETLVRDHDGTTIRISTAMGLASYLACLAAVARAAPVAARTGLTEAALAEGPPTRRGARAAAVTAGALALVLLALVGIHHLLAQGPSSLSRYLEEIGAATEPAGATCGRKSGAGDRGVSAETCLPSSVGASDPRRTGTARSRD